MLCTRVEKSRSICSEIQEKFIELVLNQICVKRENLSIIFQ